MTSAESAGVDMARAALTAAREAARQHRTPGARKAPRPTPRRANGRDPVGLGAALERMMTERGLAKPAAGGSIVGKWKEIAGADFAQHVGAEAFDAQTGELKLRPESPAWAWQARLVSGKLKAAANDLVRQSSHKDAADVVQSIKVLEPGRLPTAIAPQAAAPQAPALARRPERPCEEPSRAYHQARKKIKKHQRTPDPAVAAAIARQNQSPRMREPAKAFAEAIARQEGPRPTRPRDDLHARALAKARQERSRRQPQDAATSPATKKQEPR
ncbi:DUF721 domain-containing protein [Streptomyces sp. MS1.AVA.3]|uniref:DUF721 domain-containing protein n=1 Tax=Streptomyces decoyicus TaxID=249567 RepID=UPI0030C62C9E